MYGRRESESLTFELGEVSGRGLYSEQEFGSKRREEVRVCLMPY